MSRRGFLTRTAAFGATSSTIAGKASPRVVELDQDAPKGGGRYHVGNAYSVAGKRYVPSERAVGHSQTGLASWYGEAFHGRKTANGERYDQNELSGAHRTLPFGTMVRVRNTSNDRSVIVRINDRGPWKESRVLDVSFAAAQELDMTRTGTVPVEITVLK